MFYAVLALRQQADYAADRKVTADQAKTGIHRAQGFVEHVRSVLDHRLSQTAG